MSSRGPTLWGDFSQSLDGFVQRFKHQPHEGKTHVELQQPSEDLILARNQELRKNPGVLRDLSFGRQVASIPLIMYYKAIRDGYKLNTGDKQQRQKELQRFLATPEGQMCLVRKRM